MPESATAFARALFAGLIIGLMAIVFAISFAAIIYTGDMAQFLDRGIGLTLAGAAIMAVVGTFSLSYRGTIVQPQDVTALVLSLAVATIAAGWTGTNPDELFATVAVLVAVTTALTGFATYVFGYYGLGFVARFIPYPVLGGFLAATGYLLTLGAIGMTIGGGIDIWNLASIFDSGNPERWVPWIATGLLFCVITQRLRHGAVLPTCIVLAALGFYAALWFSGTSLADARALGLLLGAGTDESYTAGLGPWILARADWRMVHAQLPSVAVVAGLAIVGALLNASALELATGRDVNPDRDLRGVGIANMLAAIGGGMVGYHLLSQTLFARALGMTGMLCGLAVAASCTLALVFGAGFLSVLPIGVFASVIAYLGIDLLRTWLWTERRRLPARDFAIVLLILAVAATVGFLQAIVVGLLAAAIQFVIAYSRTEVIRLATTVAHMRSRVERPESELQILANEGHEAAVYQLTGFLFFGTANNLLGRISATLDADADRPRIVVLDFGRVQGIDASAAFALGKLQRGCATVGVDLMVSGLSERVAGMMERCGFVPDDTGPTVFAHLDDALREIEERLLCAVSHRAGPRHPIGFVEEIRALHPDADLLRYFDAQTVEAGTELVTQGADSDAMFVLLDGRLRAEYVSQEGRIIPVARILPGAVAGEIGHYAGVPRTARVVTESRCRLIRIDCRTLDRVRQDDPALLADLHRVAATHLARRLMRTADLLRDADM